MPSVAVELQEISLRGLSTGWLSAGPKDSAGPIVLMLHGYPDAADSWEFQTERFGADYRVIAPYVRGAGPSEKAKDVRRYGPDSVALDALAILSQIDPERKARVFVVGHDLGATHAWHLAELLKDRAAGLVTINGLSLAQMARRLRQPRQLLKSWYISLMQMPVVPEQILTHFGDRLLDFAHDQGGLDQAKRPDHTKLRPALTAPLNQYRAFVRAVPGALRERRSRLQCPVLAIFGADDAFVEPPTQAELARDAANLTIRILPGNHWLHRNDAGKINRLLEDFFKEHESDA